LCRNQLLQDRFTRKSCGTKYNDFHPSIALNSMAT